MANRYTILGNAQAYQEKTTRPPQRGGKIPVRTFSEAQVLLQSQIDQVRQAARALPKESRLDQVIVELRLHHSFLAKSHTPTRLLRHAGMQLRGSGPWDQRVQASSPQGGQGETRLEKSRRLYISATDQNLDTFENLLKGSADKDTQADLCKIEALRIPDRDDRSEFRGIVPKEELVVELVLYKWDAYHRQQALSRIDGLLRDAGIPPDAIRTKSYADGPTFIAARVAPEVVPRLEGLNFVRSTRALPRVVPTRTAVGPPSPAPLGPPRRHRPRHHIAVFDGGVHMPHAYLDKFVITQDTTSAAPETELLDHGTAVCSAALYGPMTPGAVLDDPTCGILAFRVLPDDEDDFNLYGVIDTLENEVPNLPADVRVVNLSLGPAGPIGAMPSRFTYALDRLGHETNKLFFVAVGNWGCKAGQSRIQAPADSVNNVGVGAFKRAPQTGTIATADYSCKGPGRPGCTMKPDFLCFGGSADAPFLVHDASAGQMVGTLGTSFATPLAAATAGRLFARLGPGLSTQGCRALMLHSAQKAKGIADTDQGWGELPLNEEKILECTTDRFSVLYEGSLTPRNSWKLPFLLPPGFSHDGKVQFEWTIAYAPDVDISSAGDYTLAGIEHQFRPNSNLFTFSPPQPSQERSVNLDIVTDAVQVQALVALGWTKGSSPVSDQKSKVREQKLRSERSKWDTVVRGRKGKVKRGSVVDPHLTISIVGRGDWDENDPDARKQLRAPFAAVLTVTARNYAGDLYAEVLQHYHLLKPLIIRPRNEVMIPVET